METSLDKATEEFKLILSNLEQVLYQKALEWARNVYQAILKYLDDQIKKRREKTFEIIRQDDTWYTTFLGLVKIKRRYYRSQDGSYHYLLDELLGLSKHRHITSAVQGLALELAGCMDFRQSAETLRKTTSIDLSHQTVHRLVARVADPYLKKRDEAVKWFQMTGELPQSENRSTGRILVEADGVMLSLQREKARKAEVKLGISYEGWRQVGKDRYGTVNKLAYGDLVDSDTFWAAMTLKLHEKYDLSRIQHMVLGGDGAGWIKDGASYFGAHYQLCRYHLNRELCRVLGHDRKTLRAMQQAYNQGNVDAMFGTLDAAIDSTAGEAQKALKKLLRYLKENVSGLKVYLSADGQWRRTGAIDGNVDKLIVRRMKNQGMSWSLKGIRRMLWLRLTLYEGKLNEYLSNQITDIPPHKLPAKRVCQVINKRLKQDYSSYFGAGLPALIGPHASRPWVKMLKSITEVSMP